MTVHSSIGSTPASSMPGIVADIRRYLGRRGALALAGVGVVLGLAVNWSWLVAAGVAPVLLSLLPCAAMCALGLCMKRTGTCAATQSAAHPDGPHRAAEPMTMASDSSGGRGRVRLPSAQAGIHHSPSKGEAYTDDQPLRTTSYLPKEDH